MKRVLLKTSALCLSIFLTTSCTKSHKSSRAENSLSPQSFLQKKERQSGPVHKPPDQIAHIIQRNNNASKKKANDKTNVVQKTLITYKNKKPSIQLNHPGTKPSDKQQLSTISTTQHLHAQNIKAALSAPPEQPTDGWNFIPEDFQNFLKTQGSTIKVNYQSTPMGSTAFKLNRQIVSFPSATTLLKKMGLKPKIINYLSARLQHGIGIGKPVLCPKHLATEIGCKKKQLLFIIKKFSLRTMQAWVSAEPDSFQVIPVRSDTYYLPASSSHSVSNRINYNVLASYSLTNKENRSYNLLLGDEISYSNNLLTAQAYINKTPFATYTNFNKLSLTRQLKTKQIQLGYFSSTGFSDLSGNFSSTYNGSGFLFRLSNSTALKKHNNEQTLSPIILFLSAQSKIEVYRGQELISIQMLGIGNHQLDTSSFSSGIYPVTIKIYQSGVLVQTLQKTVYKPFDTSHYNPSGYNYLFTVGIVNNHPLRFGHFDLPYFSASVQHLLGKRTRLTASGYVVSSLLVPDIDLGFYLPWNSQISLNAAMDNGGGYQQILSISLQPFYWWQATFYGAVANRENITKKQR